MTGKLFYYEKKYVAGLFDSGPKEHVEHGVIIAETLEDAREKVFNKCSVLNLRRGVTLTLAPISFTEKPLVFEGKYDGDPMAKSTKLVVTEKR